MTEESTDSKTEEVVQPPISQAPVEEPNQASASKPESDQEKNWREMRQNYDRLRRENEELKQYVQQTAAPKAPPKDEEDFNLAPDDLPEWRHVEKKYRDLESKIEQYQVANVELKLKSQFSDFDRVVTEENIQKLSQTEPEMAASLLSGKDLYKKGVSAYKLIKSLVMQEDKNAHNKERIEQNVAKPTSVSAAGAQTGSSPLHQANAFANGLTPELRTSLLKEMNEARKAW